MESKIKTFVVAGDWPKAFSTARKFFFGLSKSEKRSIEIAADCCDEGRRNFYERIAIDWQAETEAAKSFLLGKYSPA